MRRRRESDISVLPGDWLLKNIRFLIQVLRILGYSIRENLPNFPKQCGGRIFPPSPSGQKTD